MPGLYGDSFQKSMNRLALTTNLDAQGAAQVWAARPGMDLIGCLNAKAGNSGVTNKCLLGALNQLAGTTGLSQDAAAVAIP